MPEEPLSPIENISETTLEQFRKEFEPYGWLIVISGGALDALLLYYLSLALFDSAWIALFMAPWIAVFFWYLHIRGKVQIRFWKEVAESRGWSYEKDHSVAGERGLLFHQGSGRTVLHAVSGVYHEQPLSIVEYMYTTGSGKSKQTHYYTIFEVKFRGTFPHLYLNNIKNADYIDFFRKMGLPQLSLPAEFEKKFQLYAPKQYEIEALQIFSPDVLEFLLREKWEHDLELTESELIISRPMHINSASELETELTKVQTLVDRMAPTLNRIRLAEIGDYPSTL